MLDNYLSNIRYSKNNVPILSVKDIEQLAVSIINDFDPELLIEPQPIDVDAFIEFYLDYQLDVAYLSHNQTYFGRCVFSSQEKIPIYLPEKNKVLFLTNRAGTIFLDASLSDDPSKNGLRRFTLMHEAGHAVQHRKYFLGDENQLTLFDIDDYIDDSVDKEAASSKTNILNYDGKRKLETDEDWLEFQANSFASCMLMNQVSLRKFLESKDYTSDISTIQKLILIEEISETYEVSSSAAKVRLRMFDEQMNQEDNMSLLQL